MDKTKSELFAEWLNKRMKDKDWNNTDLALRAGVSKQVISKYLTQPPVHIT
jgi:DNA-binding Xre family transcriptional regulator